MNDLEKEFVSSLSALFKRYKVKLLAEFNFEYAETSYRLYGEGINIQIDEAFPELLDE